MEDLQAQLGAIMNDPAMMEKVMSMAQSLSKPQEQEQSPMPFDPAMLQRLSGLMGQTGIDANQKGLLTALRPYLSGQRIEKLEKAMRAAKMAKLASGLFNPL